MSTSRTGEEQFAPSPVVWALTSHGTLVAWTVIHKKAKSDGGKYAFMRTAEAPPADNSTPRALEPPTAAPPLSQPPAAASASASAASAAAPPTVPAPLSAIMTAQGTPEPAAQSGAPAMLPNSTFVGVAASPATGALAGLPPPTAAAPAPFARAAGPSAPAAACAFAPPGTSCTAQGATPAAAAGAATAIFGAAPAAAGAAMPLSAAPAAAAAVQPVPLSPADFLNAASKGHAEALRGAIAAGADIGARDEKGSGALHLAAKVALIRSLGSILSILAASLTHSVLHSHSLFVYS